MYLVRATFDHVGPLATASIKLANDVGSPRLMTVVLGGAGVGKTSLLRAIANTRPGNAIVGLNRSLGLAHAEPAPAQAVVCDWILGSDDPVRPHPLRITTPSLKLPGNPEEESLRRREQAFFDKRAKQGGFAYLGISAARWFSRQPILINAPARSLLHYDPRASANFDDATHADLARETKQALAYAAIAPALASGHHPAATSLHRLGEAMRSTVDCLVALVDCSYVGVDPHSLEPLFRHAGGGAVTLDGLPTRARHLVAFAALSVRTLWAAYPGTDPREAEGLVAIDDVSLHQDEATQARLVACLRTALPRVQWLLSTDSALLAGSCDATGVIALKRLPDTRTVRAYVGDHARVH